MIIVLLWPAAIALSAAGPPLAVVLLGTALGGACLALGLLPRETRVLERLA